MSTLDRAIEISINAHRDQFDKTGAPYILHVLRVMHNGKTEVEKICGVLHDLIEDTPWTLDDLQKEGFSREVIHVLRLVTKTSEDEDYQTFINRVATNPTAIQVKLNDLKDNLDIRRLQEVSENDLPRLNKYLKAYHYLQEK
jgi:(p)ppGpp synthase/HD superfamily hydrolase